MDSLKCDECGATFAPPGSPLTDASGLRTLDQRIAEIRIEQDRQQTRTTNLVAGLAVAAMFGLVWFILWLPDPEPGSILSRLGSTANTLSSVVAGIVGLLVAYRVTRQRKAVGLTMVIVGAILSFSGFGAVVGIPLIFVGGLLLLA